MDKAKKTQVLTMCAILAAVVCALNFIASLHIIRLDLVFYLISGALVYFAVMRFGVGPGAALYAAASLLSLALVPDKVWLLFFISVFGPGAVIQAILKKRMGSKLALLLTVVFLFILFYFAGWAVAYVGGFTVNVNIALPIDLPDSVRIHGMMLAVGFAVFSAVVACVVNLGLYALLLQRLHGTAGSSSASVDARATKTESKNVCMSDREASDLDILNTAKTTNKGEGFPSSAQTPLAIVLPKLSNEEENKED